MCIWSQMIFYTDPSLLLTSWTSWRSVTRRTSKMVVSISLTRLKRPLKNGSILQYFWPSLSYHKSLRPLFYLFLSGRLSQDLLYIEDVICESQPLTALTLLRPFTATIFYLQISWWWSLEAYYIAKTWADWSGFILFAINDKINLKSK